MPRLGRLDAPGVVHHIMIRGIERRNIFRDDGDREDFLARLAALVPATQITCYNGGRWILFILFDLRGGGTRRVIGTRREGRC